MTTARDLRPLFITAVLMASSAAVFGAAMLVDPRTVDGAPVWLKPAKFGLSTAVYAITLAWVLNELPAWPRVRRAAATTTAVVFIGEVLLIAVQAGRGTASHFNISTPADGAIFFAMGAGIFAQTATAVAVMVALWRQPFADVARGWALRAGMALAVAGALTGPLMTRPTPAQLEAARLTGQMPRSGAHTVGAPDGGPGVPGTGWSATHGDVRVPHFVGLHAIQVLPIVAWVTGRRRSSSQAARLVAASAASYTALFLILLAQALQGQSVVAPAGSIAVLLGAWAVGTVVALAIAARPRGARAASATVWGLS